MLHTLLVAATLAAYCAANTPPDTHRLRTRNIIDAGSLAAEYDFVIAGGGLAGLVLASRLSEDANTTVLVLEAGDTGDAVASSIDVPGNAYYSTLLGTSYDWKFVTVPQTAAGNRTITWPRGKVLGGSTAVNGLYYVRPSALEVDAWGGMITGSEASAWTWNALYAAMKKSETFHAPSDAVVSAGAIQYNAAAHGTDGPLQVAYPGYIVPLVSTWTTTLDNIGIPTSPDANSGDGWGGFVATSTINPANWTRSYARSAYIDPLPPRPNLAVLANATVTRLLFASGSSNLTATGVEWAATRDGARQTVNVRKEVIVAGGAIGSPSILMHSGIGPRDVLEAAGVTVLVELPGVGQHLQDHISSQVTWKTSAEAAASIHQANATNLPNGQSSPFLSFINSATAYANVSDLLGPDFAPTYQNEIAAALNDSLKQVPSQYPEVAEGYKAIYNTNVNTILMSQVGQVELLFSLTGSSIGGSQSISIQAALQHPFSAGRLWITTSDPFDAPTIDPQYLAHFADTVTLREGLKLARKLGATEPLHSSLLDELSPGPSVSSDADWDAFVATSIGTEFHPSGSCAMLPQAQGGVVDANLRVYGTANVRVADASVYPIEFAAHLMAPTYGLAEQAASIVRAQWNGAAPPTAAQGGANNTDTPGAGPKPTGTSGNDGLRTVSSWWAPLALAACAMWASL